MPDLLKIREQVLATNKKAETTRGSGWHPGDLGAELRDLKNELPLSQRPVVIQHDDRMHVVGPCVETVKAALQAYLARHKPRAVKGKLSNYELSIIKHAERACEQGGMIVLDTQAWNYVNHALAEQGVLVASTHAVEEE